MPSIENLRTTNQLAVVITGASTGISRASALHLERIGFRVFAGVRRTADGEALRREASSRLTPVLLDGTELRPWYGLLLAILPVWLGDWSRSLLDSL
jgi:NAD(P)-dependent dehydrogenase (short-subunit alcohol dehydrogenase family)